MLELSLYRWRHTSRVKLDLLVNFVLATSFTGVTLGLVVWKQTLEAAEVGRLIGQMPSVLTNQQHQSTEGLMS